MNRFRPQSWFRLLCAAWLTLSASALAQDNPVLVGTVFKVTDGDTIKVQLTSGPINVRFDSIDAPESNQPHGAQAKAALAKLLDGKQVQLDVVTQDRYERVVAVVYVGDLNVNEQMVKDGHAWAYREYLKNWDYCRWEDQARQQKRGVWALKTTDWIYPSDWRRWRRKTIEEVRDYSGETAQRCLSAIGGD
jgi:endonuclease YncB( thermonuclease family)